MDTTYLILFIFFVPSQQTELQNTKYSYYQDVSSISKHFTNEKGLDELYRFFTDYNNENTYPIGVPLENFSEAAFTFVCKCMNNYCDYVYGTEMKKTYDILFNDVCELLLDPEVNGHVCKLCQNSCSFQKEICKSSIASLNSINKWLVPENLFGQDCYIEFTFQHRNYTFLDCNINTKFLLNSLTLRDWRQTNSSEKNFWKF
jgi:hypothetical protein